MAWNGQEFEDIVQRAIIERGVGPSDMDDVVKVLLMGGKAKAEDTEAKSRQMEGDPFGQAAGEFIPPKFDPKVWAQAMEQSARLARCIRSFARNTIGLGWYIEPVHRITQDTADEERKEYEAQSECLRTLFEFPNEEMPLSEIFYLLKIDEEATGNGYLEVVRNNAGRIVGLFHAPSVTMRIRTMKEMDEITGKEVSKPYGFLQIRGNEKRYFKKFGDRRQMDAVTGAWAEEGGEPIPPARRATEVIHFRIYVPTVSYYGAPRYVPAATAITGNRLAAMRNVTFFENDAPQPLDAKIMTPHGWSTMGAMAVGSHIIGSDGKPHVVTEIVPQGMKEVYRLTFSDGSSTECTQGHLWRVTNSYDRKRGVDRVMSLSEIMKDGFHYDCGAAKWAIPLVDPIEYEPVVPLPLDPYFLGLLLGDGSFRDDKVTLAVNWADADEAETIVEPVLPDDVKISRRDRGGWSEFHFSRVKGTAQGNRMAEIIRGLDLANLLGKDKFIPEIYLRASVRDRIAMLQGLIDSDGHVGDTAVRFVTTSTKLADGVAELVGSLGGICTIRPMKGRTTLQLTIRQIPESITPARLSRKAKAYAPADTPRIRTMEGAELVRKTETRCIRVDVADSLYVTDGFILTHNTPRFAVLVSGGRLTQESQQQIEDFLRGKARGVDNAHRAMIIQVEPTRVGFQQQQRTMVELRPLTVGVTEDASFQTYRAANDEEIREVMGIAQIFLNSDGANRASAAASRDLTNEQEFEPDRGAHEYILNQTIVTDMLCDDMEQRRGQGGSRPATEKAEIEVGGGAAPADAAPAQPISFGKPAWARQQDATTAMTMGSDEHDRREMAERMRKHICVRFRFARPVNIDQLDQAQLDSMYANAGALTPNELREKIGRPPYPKEYTFGDKPMAIAMAELSAGIAMAIAPSMQSQGLQPPPEPGPEGQPEEAPPEPPISGALPQGAPDVHGSVTPQIGAQGAVARGMIPQRGVNVEKSLQIMFDLANDARRLVTGGSGEARLEKTVRDLNQALSELKDRLRKIAG